FIVSPVIIIGNGAIIERSTAPGIPAFRLWFIGYGGGSLTLQNVTTRNGASDAFFGGGFFNLGSLTLIDSAVMSNTVHGYGGAIRNDGVLVLRNSTIRYNQAGTVSGIDNYGVMTITNSTISDNRGGNGYAAVHNSAGGQSTLEQSTITANQGQGISNNGVMLVRNSTISGNQHDGFYNEGGIATISHSTISNNNGSGLYNTQSLTLHNSIVAAQRTGVDCVGTISATRNNMDSDGSCGEATTATAPQLGPLQVNGPGNTATHALLSGSPAIDAGDPGTCLATDQRGVTRPLDGNGDNVAVCDLGAYEALAATFATITISHDAVPNSATNFRFSGGLRAFYLDDITPQDGDAYGNSKQFTVAPGVYNVTAVVPSTWGLAGIVCNPSAKGTVNLALKRVTLRVVAGDNVTCTFTNHYKATINTLVFHDLNQNRVYNSGEPGLPGWTVRIYDLNNTQLFTRTTDAAGKANFVRQLIPNVPYKVCVDVASGWTRTVPTTVDSVLGKPCYSTTPTPGQTVTLRFGNKPLAVNAAEETVTELAEDVTIEETPELAPDESGYDAGYVEEEETAPPSDQPAAAQTQSIFLPIVSNNTP
ncbi:MAG: choice-of-anchor Q domain-containing protein, partial [Caldilineaceae bacterium]